MSIFRGSGVALVTPFTDREEIDYEALNCLIEFQITNGTDAIIICGCTGEAATLTNEERLACIRHTIGQVSHRVPVIAGTGTNCTKTTLSLSMEAEALGADALLIITPYYNKCTQAGLFAHYRTVAESVTIPIILYNVPSRTGVNLLPQTAIALAKECKNIVAIKEASGNISQLADLAALSDGVLDLYSGNDDMIVPLLSLGGIGVISVLSNILPRQTHDMVTAFLRRETETATRLQLETLPLTRALFSEVNPIPVKYALSRMGLCGETLRAPLTPLEKHHRDALQKLLLDFSLLMPDNTRESENKHIRLT